VVNEVVEEITEIPTTPPPRVTERTVVEPAGPPQVVKKVIRVPPRGGSYSASQQQGASVASNADQANNLLGAGSYGNVQQASSSYQQFGGPTSAVGPTSAFGTGAFYAGGYSGAEVNTSGYGSVGGGHGSAAGGYGSAAGGFGSYGGGFQQQGSGFGQFPSQRVPPPPGIPPNATCFYV